MLSATLQSAKWSGKPYKKEKRALATFWPVSAGSTLSKSLLTTLENVSIRRHLSRTFTTRVMPLAKLKKHSFLSMNRECVSAVYEAIRYHKLIASINSSLRAGKFATLAAYCGFSDYTKLYSRDSTEKDCAPKPKLDIQKQKLPDIESELLVKHAGMIAELEKKLGDDPEFASCSCERLLQRKSFLNQQSSRQTSGMNSRHTCTCQIPKPQAKHSTCASTAGPF